MKPGVRRVEWKPCWHMVSSRFPPVGLFDRVASQGDLDIVLQIEGLTNDRVRQEVGEISFVDREDRVFGPGTTPIMAAFTHPNPVGSRFTDGSYGVYYAAKDIDTAIAETRFHRNRFLAATNEPPIEIDMRSYASDLAADLHDLRGLKAELPSIYDPEPARYGAAQALARDLRENGSDGLVYESVRDPAGESAAVFRPRVLSPVRQGPHFCYVWDGQAITMVYRKARYEPSDRA